MLSINTDTSNPPPNTSSVQAATVVSALVHDLRQPLSVVEACADYLDLVLPAADCRSRQQLELLQQQVRDANRIMHEALLKLHFREAARDPLTSAA